MKKIIYIFICQLTLIVSMASAQTVKLYSKAGVLKGTYTKILDAGLAAADGDSILLSPHNFYEHNTGTPKSDIVLQGTISGKDTSTINAQNLGSCIGGFNGTIRDVIITGGHSVVTSSGIEDFGGAIYKGHSIHLTGYTTIRNNQGLDFILDFWENTVIDGNVKIINNTVTDSISLLSGPITVRDNIAISGNVLISGNSGGDAGAMYVIGLNKGDSVETKSNAHLIINGNVRIENNMGKRSSAILFAPVGRYAEISGAAIVNNHCSTVGFGAAAIVVDSFGFGPGPAAIIGKDTIGYPVIRLNNVRIYNPLADGKRNREVWLRKETIIAHRPAIFTSESCWWGDSDTTGIFSIEDDGKFTTNNWAVTNWFCLPMSTSSTKVMSVMRLNTGAALPANSLKGLEGKFFATAGTFSAPTSTITSGNVVAGDYTYPSSGTFAVTAVIDADTFKPTTKMLGIKEQGFEQVKIYPNPATDVINISGTTEGSMMTLLDISGKIIMQQISTGSNNTIPLNKLSSGTYLLKIEDKEGREGTAKIMKE